MTETMATVFTIACLACMAAATAYIVFSFIRMGKQQEQMLVTLDDRTRTILESDGSSAHKKAEALSQRVRGGLALRHAICDTDDMKYSDDRQRQSYEAFLTPPNVDVLKAMASRR